MKRIINIIFVVSMFLSVALAIQDTAREEDNRESGSSKATGISGTLSADGERLVDEAGRVYTINNPATVTQYAGQRVALKARLSADKMAVNVELVRMIGNPTAHIG